MKKIEKQLDNLWKQCIRVINGYDKDDRTVESHHVFSRANKNTRWSLCNGYILKVYEHRVLKHHSAEAEKFFRSKLGDEEYERLERKSREIKKWEEWELIQIKSQFQELIRRFEK